MAARRNTPRQDEYIAKGRAAAMMGVGVSDRQAELDAVTEACGAFALSDRSAWLVGHELAVRDLEAMAAEAEARMVREALARHGLRAEPAERALRGLVITDGSLRFELRVLAVEGVPEPIADEDREPDPQEPEDADEAQAVGEDPRIAEAEWERDHGWRYQ